MHDSNPETLSRALKRYLEARPEVLEAYLFGSLVSGQAQEHSDVDVAVYVDKNAAATTSPFGYVAELTAELSTALGRNDVDVVILNRATPLLYQRVLRGGLRLLTRDARATTTREGQALSRYCDYVPQLRKIDAASGNRIARGRFGQ